MMWAWDFDSSDGPGSQNLDMEKMGDCSLTNRKRSLWRTFEDMPIENCVQSIKVKLDSIWKYGINKGLIEDRSPR